MQIARFLGSWRGLMVRKPVRAATGEMNPCSTSNINSDGYAGSIVQLLLPRWLPILGPSPVHQRHLRCHFVIGSAAP